MKTPDYRLRNLPDFSFPALKTVWHLGHMGAELAAVRTQMGINGALSEKDLTPVRPSTADFFILGSGSSVLRLGEQDWGSIRAGTSIGINSWAFHTFTPDILTLEDIHSPELLPQKNAVALGLERMSKLSQIPLVLKFRTPANVDEELRMQFPKDMHSKVRVYGRFQIPPFSRPTKLRSAIRMGLKLDRAGLVPQSVLIDHGASVIRMIHLAVRAGARRIILVGVDLLDSPYFFEEDPSFLLQIGAPKFSRTPESGNHGTVERRPGSESVANFLSQLRIVLLEDTGVQLMAMRPSQALNGIMPEFSG